MPTQWPLYQELLGKMWEIAGRSKVRKTSIRRLALLVLGIIAAESCVIAKVAPKLHAMNISDAAVDSIRRRLRRTIGDKGLDPKLCYEPVLHQAIDWQGLLKASRRLFLIVDESAKEDEIHLLRFSLAYWGGAVPLVWAVWEQNKNQSQGTYWANVDAVLARVAALIPAGFEVIVTADRAYDIPAFVDRIAALGWHWLVRVKIGSSLRFLDWHQQEHVLGELVRRNVKVPGMRWKTRGRVFKKAGWREGTVVVMWAAGEKEPLAVMSDLPPRWELLHWYGRRFWTEPSFRNDKKRGWQWEESQTKGVPHHERMLLAMAWASLTVLCLGVQEAKARRDKLVKTLASKQRPGKAPAKSEHARESLFTMGLRSTYHWWNRTCQAAFQWLLPEVDSVSWFSRWHQQQSYRYKLKTVLP